MLVFFPKISTPESFEWLMEQGKGNIKLISAREEAESHVFETFAA